MTVEQSSFLYSANADFIAELYQRYAANPSNVDPSWRSFFTGLGDDAKAALSEARGASWSPARLAKIIANDAMPPTKPAAGGVTSAPLSASAAIDSLHAAMLIRVYRVRGHLLANLDPLGLAPRAYSSELDPKTYGFEEKDYDRPIFIDGMLGFGPTATMREILARVHATYCGSIGVEFMHIQDPDQKSWIQQRIEGALNKPNYNKAQKTKILERLTAGESFEKFLATKFVGAKRFGLEGGEAMIPALEAALARAASLGLREVVIGMAHRGRLNMLTNMLGKSFTAMFSEFQGTPAYPDSFQGVGDVKYHLGVSVDSTFAGQTIHLTMNANPSHLEWVNPVVTGRVRAKQQQRTA